MSYRIVVHKRVVTYLRRLPEAHKERIKAGIRQLEENPTMTSQTKAMIGVWTGYRRLRVGNWRVIYWVDESTTTIYVDYAGPRGDVYKNTP